MRNHRLVLLLSGSLLAAAPVSPPARAAYIFGYAPGNTTACLTVNGPGSAAVLWPCGSIFFIMGQQWSLDGFQITTQGLCLDTQGEALSTGTHVIVQPCTGSASQTWIYNNGAINTGNGMCLTLAPNVQNQAFLSPCAGLVSQSFGII
ncbi:MAG TPA: RICIN domain-containing protein [Methylocella sp.]|nr:RICIN domain-containing protein [Methylocella sp.]